MRQLTSLDAQFLAAEDGCVHGHVTGLAVYDAEGSPRGRLTRDDVRDIVAARLHLVPPFRRRLVRVPLELDLPYWIEDPDFDLERHIASHVLPAPGGHVELAEHVSRLMAEPLDLARPPWSIDVITGLKGGRVAVATRIHHAASDGLAMAELFATMHDPSAAERNLGEALPEPERVPRRAEMLLRGLAGVPHQPRRFLQSAPRALPHLDQVVTLRAIPGVPQLASLVRRSLARRRPDDGDLLPGANALAPRTRTTGKLSSRRAVAFTSTSLPEVKAIKAHFAVSVNDVIMAITAGALRAWLERHADLPGDPLAAMVPVSVRSPGESGAFDNRIAMMIPPVFTDEPDAVRRLRRTHEAMRVAKERHRAVPATLLQDANHFIPPMLLARAARATARFATSPRRRRTAANLLISNIPGARQPQYLGGCRLIGHFPLSAIFHGMGLNITIVSYIDQIDWGIVLDPAQIDDAWGLCEAIKQAQAELAALAEREPAGAPS